MTKHSIVVVWMLQDYTSARVLTEVVVHNCRALANNCALSVMSLFAKWINRRCEIDVRKLLASKHNIPSHAVSSNFFVTYISYAIGINYSKLSEL